jgi:type VI secretion system protein
MSYALFDVLNGYFLGGGPVRAASRETALRSSIQDHLTRIFNSRRGALTHLPDYGLPDLTSVYQELPYSIEALACAVRLCVERYEPRIKHVRVVPQAARNGEHVIRMLITGVIGADEPLRLQTYFMSGGSARVTGGS